MRGDLTGQLFARLLVLRFVRSVRHGTRSRRLWLCLCECEARVEVRTDNLKNGHARSCGCLGKEKARERTKHGGCAGGYPSPEYISWRAMKTRCLNQNHPHYDDYGGRGITIDPRWVNDFAAFVADMGKRPSAIHSLDRKDPNGPYTKANCRWATPVEQAQTKRKGEKELSREEWADLGW